MGAERSVLWVLLHDPDHTYHESVAEQIGPDDFVDPTYRAVFRAVLDAPDLSCAPEGMEARAAATLEELLADERDVSNIERTFQESVNRIRQKPLQAKKRELMRMLREAEAAEDEPRQKKLLDELNRLKAEQKEMGAGWESSAPGVFRSNRANQTDETSP